MKQAGKQVFVVSFEQIVTKSMTQRPKKHYYWLKNWSQLNHTHTQMMSKQSKFTKESPLFFQHCLEFPFRSFEILLFTCCNIHFLRIRKKCPMIFDYRLMIVHLSIVSLLFNFQSQTKRSFIRNCLQKEREACISDSRFDFFRARSK